MKRLRHKATSDRQHEMTRKNVHRLENLCSTSKTLTSWPNKNLNSNLEIYSGDFKKMELCLRLLLSHLDGSISPGNPEHGFFFPLPVGSEVPASAWSNYASLKQLIVKYNDWAGDKERKISLNFVSLRDAFAHGRCMPTSHGVFQLIKFSKPDGGNVTVEFNEMLTDEWFVDWQSKVHEETLELCELLMSLQKQTWHVEQRALN